MTRAFSPSPVGIHRDLDDEALDWVVRLTSGDPDANEIEAFRAWRDQSPLHKAALADARKLWVDLGAILVVSERENRTRAHWPADDTVCPMQERGAGKS